MLLGGLAGLTCFLAVMLKDVIGDAGVYSVISFVTLATYIFILIRANGRVVGDVLLAVVPAAVVSLLAIWVSMYSEGDGLTFAFNLSMSIALYCGLAFIQSWQLTGNLKFPYEVLFKYGWNNGFIVILAACFAAAFWALIAIWSGLFKLINISLFKEIFSEPLFIFVAGYSAMAVGISLARDNVRVIETFRRLTLSFIKGLMPLLSFIGLLFVVTLIFTGLDLLFSSVSATGLMLAMSVLAILFLNGIYQDGSLSPPYHPLIRHMVHGLLLVLPLYSLVAIYAMYLRIDQYGLMPDRLYGMVVAIVLGVYSLGYAFSVFRSKHGWLKDIERVNVYVAMLIISMALLLQSPVLDVNRISVNNQMARLMGGNVSAADFDYGALKFKLGVPGEKALDDLLTWASHPQFEIISENVEKVMKAESYYQTIAKGRVRNDDVRILSSLELWPEEQVLDEKTLKKIASNLRWDDRNDCRSEQCLMVVINMDDEPDMEYLIVRNRTNVRSLNVYKISDENCRIRKINLSGGDSVSYNKLIELIKRNKLSTRQSPLQDLMIGDMEFSSN